jgi:hypothetical protein
VRLIPLILAAFSLQATADEFCTTPHPVMSLMRHCQAATGAKIPPAVKFLSSETGGSNQPNYCYNTMVQFDQQNSTVSVFKTDREGRLWVYRYRAMDMASNRELCLNEGFGEEYRTTSPSVESGIVAGFSGGKRYIGVTPATGAINRNCKGGVKSDPIKEAPAADNTAFRMVLAAFKKGILDTSRAATEGNGKVPAQFENCVTMFEEIYQRDGVDAFNDAERPLVANALSGPPSINSLIKENSPTTIESIINETGTDGP